MPLNYNMSMVDDQRRSWYNSSHLTVGLMASICPKNYWTAPFNVRQPKASVNRFFWCVRFFFLIFNYIPSFGHHKHKKAAWRRWQWRSICISSIFDAEKIEGQWTNMNPTQIHLAASVNLTNHFWKWNSDVKICFLEELNIQSLLVVTSYFAQTATVSLTNPLPLCETM